MKHLYSCSPDSTTRMKGAARRIELSHTFYFLALSFIHSGADPDRVYWLNLDPFFDGSDQDPFSRVGPGFQCRIHIRKHCAFSSVLRISIVTIRIMIRLLDLTVIRIYNRWEVNGVLQSNEKKYLGQIGILSVIHLNSKPL